MSNYQACYYIQGDVQSSVRTAYTDGGNSEKWSNSVQCSSPPPPKKSKKNGQKGGSPRDKVARSEADFLGIGAQFDGYVQYDSACTLCPVWAWLIVPIVS